MNPTDQTITDNEKRGYFFVGTVNGDDVWKKKSVVGSWTYVVDRGWEEIMTIWDTAFDGIEMAELILNDLKKGSL